MIKSAMVLAAGFGKRMLPLTQTTPKPLLEVGGKPMLGWVLDHLKEAGVENVCVNGHYLGNQIKSFVESYEGLNLEFVAEEDILETGGGVRNMLLAKPDWFSDPFFVLNSDSLWLNGPQPTLEIMANFWDSEKMDSLVGLAETIRNKDEHSPGDFFLEPDNSMRRRYEQEVTPYLYMGVHIWHPRAYEKTKVENFSINKVWDQAEEDGNLYGILHEGSWFHVGTPRQLQVAQEKLEKMQTSKSLNSDK